jgi:adenylate cyclase
MIKVLTHWLTVIITLAVLVGLRLQDGGLSETARLKSFDYLQSTDTVVESNDIVIVELDEKSIESFGQWPWPRNYLADIISHLRSQGAGLIVMPILFSEEDRNGQDDALAQILQGNGVIIAQTGTTQINKNAVPRGIAKIGDPLPWLFEWPGMLGPIPILGENADGVGVLNIAPERDGVVRRMPLIMTVNGETYPAMAIETIRVATQAPSYQVKAGPTGVQAVRVPGYPTITTDSYARIWLRWNKQFPTVSIMDAMAEHVQGKTVIIGLTAEGIGSTIATPTGTEYAHTPIAVSLQTIINGDNIVRSDLADTYELAYLFVLGLILIIGARFLHYGILAGVIVLAGVGTVYGAVYLYSSRLMLFDFSWPVITIVLVGFHAVFNRFVSEYIQKQQIKKQFGGYASPTVVKLLQENPALVKEGIKKEVSICFSDLRGFTPLGESFGDDVQGLTRVMNGYMDAITKPVLDANGMIIKYIGDASMHIHNAPIDDPDHPKTAVQTGLNMLKAVEKYNEDLQLDGRPAVGMGAGINTGLGYIGEMGSTERHSYDVLGDAVSTTARLESQCKAYGVLLIIGPETVRRTKDDFFYLKLDDLAVKGKTVGLDIYTVLDDVREDWYDSRELHDQMHKAYQKQDFDTASYICERLKLHFDGKMTSYYDMWMERCSFMKTQDLPKDWNGVFIATTK